MGEDDASVWVLDELEDGKDVLIASKTEDIHPDEGGFVSLLVLDMDAYAENWRTPRAGPWGCSTVSVALHRTPFLGLGIKSLL